ncbi:IS66-like element accessory protein TnpA [Variovorax rhizosphaerae]|uniref:Transposase n=1 Tax=Variovorax rhizosphaerae TaxID=1836200 RepID=A0ABU8WYL4_9BURK
MNPNSLKRRRTHDPEFKAKIMAECEQPGASVAAVSLAHGLNVNLVRKWLVGRGLKRAGLSAPRTVASRPPVEPTRPGSSTSPQALHFVPVELASEGVDVAPAVDRSDAERERGEADIHIELQRGETRLTVQWPGSQAAHCAAWLGEVAAAALK